MEIASRQSGADGLWLARRLDLGDITFMQATPSTWRMLLDAGWQGAAETDDPLRRRGAAT